MKAKIIRIDISKQGVFGVFTLNNDAFCLTLERPWEDNKPNISCIPVNIYLCQRVDSPKYGDTFQIMDVENRTNILFHVGNKISNSLGCVLLGSSYGELEGERAVVSSGTAFFRFMKRMEGIDSFPLQIINL